ncbi:bifunctional diguanylate cyclase/phosphodiesterase [Quadrisphaera sp. INWT6]|uniref:putative bifunctional diguanylate cyclase/phosphodiesterase n=1 Tax=Quadrisphaera sp. INWT6 TaxID=2596917 RepID=UPI0018925156|nr:bifunctional diguanylate cyclase/phosphodiesterase [Quadrisphaera sp. INWT6]MBF5081945.1 EAL domain-containing protein [Quadrisphaera sp. INWT6]
MPPPPWSPSASPAPPVQRAAHPAEPSWAAVPTSSVAAAVWELDLVTGALHWSDGMHRIAGSDPTTTRPSMQWWTSLVVPADRARVRAWLLVVREGRRGSEEQFDLVGADGVQRRVHAWTEVELDAAGGATRLFGSAVDISAAAAVGHRDPLTDLGTRHAVVAHLAAEAAEARRQRVPGGAVLAVLDLDRFSVLDDALGRDTGDALLVATADRLRTAAPEGATVARLDGDSFAVVVGRDTARVALASGGHHRPAAGPDAAGLAERLLAALRRPTRLHGRTDHVTLTASVGLVTTDGTEADPEDVVRRAGLALRRAKRDGGDRVVHYAPGLGEAALHRVATETMLRSALDAERLRVLYQPVIDLRTGEVVGVEALARVIDPERGAISPALFVDVAEETGLVVRLDEWVLGRASTMAQQWSPPASGAPTTIALPDTPSHPGLPTVAVNMSSKTLQRPDLAGLVRGALQRSGSDPSRLLVEITEHSLLDQGDGARDTLDGLTDLGVSVGIDDFGTGWSALSYLSALDLAFMKVDRAFVSRLGVDSSASAVVQAVIDLAHAHHLTVIAEGIETEEQARMLIAMGCDHGQGYWFGRPTPEEELDDAIRAWHTRARAARFGSWALEPAAPAAPPARTAPKVPAAALGAPRALSLRP